MVLKAEFVLSLGRWVLLGLHFRRCNDKYQHFYPVMLLFKKQKGIQVFHSQRMLWRN